MFAAQEKASDNQGDRRLFALIGYDDILVVNLYSDFRGNYNRDKYSGLGKGGFRDDSKV